MTQRRVANKIAASVLIAFSVATVHRACIGYADLQDQGVGGFGGPSLLLSPVAMQMALDYIINPERYEISIWHNPLAGSLPQHSAWKILSPPHGGVLTAAGDVSLLGVKRSGGSLEISLKFYNEGDVPLIVPAIEAYPVYANSTSTYIGDGPPLLSRELAVLPAQGSMTRRIACSDMAGDLSQLAGITIMAHSGRWFLPIEPVTADAGVNSRIRSDVERQHPVPLHKGQ